jgi:hypothetical protein
VLFSSLGTGSDQYVSQGNNQQRNIYSEDMGVSCWDEGSHSPERMTADSFLTSTIHKQVGQGHILIGKLLKALFPHKLGVKLGAAYLPEAIINFEFGPLF